MATEQIGCSLSHIPFKGFGPYFKYGNTALNEKRIKLKIPSKTKFPRVLPERVPAPPAENWTDSML